MMARTHVAFGAALALAAAQHDLIELTPLSFGACLVGTLLPDVDHPKSTFGKVIAPISTVVAAIVGHRGLTHSIWAVAACLAAILKPLPAFGGQPDAESVILAALALGYVSHIIGDLLTVGGVPLFWPFPVRFRLPVLAFKTGGVVETGVLIALAGWVSFALWRALQPALATA